ncbi:MAG TPA: hypothetical protein VHA10_00115 [Hypericibacter adhaerens]|jgi:ElaB/YqjD/DUF883 family membrane-anchored ribosome-binding protein|uniref:hypothetical protein n=1 Tax=Hypericibacter adhaerens TaxID=2602016 RepID=UPI002C859865|nr:hypothetical protein [Hypericibacter adhaerens]HWA41584.1 hypothetical protein [Hypericibacter adhaerens]
MKASSEDVSLNAVREDLDQLRADLKNVMEALGKLNSDAGDAVKDQAARAAGTIGRKAEDIFENLKGEGDRVSKLLTAAVNEHPYSSLAIALAIGIIIGRTLDRR